MNDLSYNAVDLAWIENDRGYFRIASTLKKEVSAEVILTIAHFSFNSLGNCPENFNFISNTSDITGNLKVFLESKKPWM